MSLKENILSGIGAESHAFTVNGSGAITDRIASAVSAEDWAALDAAMGNTVVKKRRPAYIRTMNEHVDAVSRMSANRNVTVLMPPHTRLAAVKKVMKKLNMTTTRFQEDFNTASLDAVSALAEYAIEADRRINDLTEENEALRADVEDKAREQKELSERMIAELEKLRKPVEALKKEK